MNSQVILVCFVLGGACLAAWFLARYPSVRPRRLATVVFAVLSVFAGLRVAAVLFEAVSTLGPHGVAVALLVVVLPALTFTFWVSGAVLRTLAELPGLR